MNPIRPIRNDDDLAAAEAEVARLWAREHPPEGTPEADRIEVLSVLIDDYNRRHPMPAIDPITAIEAAMEHRGLTRKDLGPMIGSRSRVAEVLNRKRGLSIAMIRRLHEGLSISLETLVQPTIGEDEAADAPRVSVTAAPTGGFSAKPRLGLKGSTKKAKSAHHHR